MRPSPDAFRAFAAFPVNAANEYYSIDQLFDQLIDRLIDQLIDQTIDQLNSIRWRR